MPRKPDMELREKVRLRYAALVAEHPLTRLNLKQMVATELGLSERSVWYFLRGREDARTKYTEADRSFLKTASYTEIREWAKTRGRNPVSVYAAARRMRNAPDERPSGRHHQRLQEQNFLDFGNSADLRAVGATKAEFTEAKLRIYNKVGLSLLSPNFLIHPEKQRHIALSLSEQVEILKDPLGFLHRLVKTADVRERWVPDDGQFAVVVQTPGGHVIAALHKTHEAAAQALRGIARHAPALTPTVIMLQGEGYAPGGQVEA